MNAEKLGEILAGYNIIEGAAIDDPEGYDDGRTLRHLANAAIEIEQAFKVEFDELKKKITKLEKVALFDAWRIKRLTGEVAT